MDALIRLGALSTEPLEVECHYRFQSSRETESGSLHGRVVTRATTLSSNRINDCLRDHPRWHGSSLVNLMPAVVWRRTGVFERHADALYYSRNFCLPAGALIQYDILDVTKLVSLFEYRIPILHSVFTSETIDWAISAIGQVERTVVNEYMCHEAGHCLGFPVSEKYVSGFFRFGGRVRWPLIYMEEYRADANSWAIANKLLSVPEAAAVVLYTLVHRIGIAAQNLREGEPGVGYVPFLHFALLFQSGLLEIKEVRGRRRIALASLDASRVIEAAKMATEAVDREINHHEDSHDHLDCANASLSFAVARLQSDNLAALFHEIVGSGADSGAQSKSPATQRATPPRSLDLRAQDPEG
jgi:hypothetical protein